MPITVSDVTINRILSYAGFSIAQKVQELDELDLLIRDNPNKPLLYSARGKIKTQLKLNSAFDMVQRFRLDPAFFEEWLVEHAKLRGTTPAALKRVIDSDHEKFLLSHNKIEEFTDRAINNESLSLNAKINVLTQLLDAKQYDHAKRLAEALLKKYSESHLVLFNCAAVYTRFHKFTKAFELYLCAYELNDRDPVYLTHVIGSLLEREEYSQAIAILEKGLPKVGNNKVCIEYLAVCYLKTSQNQKLDAVVQQLKSIDDYYQPRHPALKSYFKTPAQKEAEKQLRVAASDGNYPLVRQLIEAGVDINSCGEDTKRTPLHWLCRSKAPLVDKLKIYRLFAETGFKVISDKDGNTPFHHLILTDNYEFFNQILNSIEEVTTNHTNVFFTPNKGGELIPGLLNMRMLSLQKIIKDNTSTMSDSPLAIAAKVLLQQARELSENIQKFSAINAASYEAATKNI